MSNTEDWAETIAGHLRDLADTLENAWGIKPGRETWGEIQPGWVHLPVDSTADVDHLARLLGVPAELEGGTYPKYVARRVTPELHITVVTPAVTIPRACPYCDQKHDCTHLDSEEPQNG